MSVLWIFSGHFCSSLLCVLVLWLFANFEESTCFVFPYLGLGVLLFGF